MKRNALFLIISVACLLFVAFQFNVSKGKKSNTTSRLIERGKYLVEFGGCNDCHSPKVMTKMGPVPDSKRLLSGFPSSDPIPPIDMSMIAPGHWILASTNTTAWVGPWGISFARNLTPDSSTGIGAWSLNDFINTLRKGKHLGSGRDILPPMPWEGIGRLSNNDLKAMFAYLKSLPPIHNEVPNPVPPNMVAKYAKE